MKVTYLHQYFATPNSTGGVRSYLIAKKLVEAGHHVDMVTTSAFLPADMPLSSGWNTFDVDGITVHALNLKYSNKMSVLKRLIAFSIFLFSSFLRIMRLDKDIIYATSTPLTVAIPAGISAKLQHKPFVFEVRDVWPDIPIVMGYLTNPIAKNIALYIEKWAYSTADFIVPLSDGMADRIRSKGVDRCKLKVVENFSDNDLFKEPYLGRKLCQSFSRLKEHQGSVLVYTGTLGRVNNIGYLVLLAEELKRSASDALIAIVGDGQEKDDIIRLAKEKGVFNENLLFLPPVQKQELPAVLALSDMSISTVLPIKELWDNSANKFFDALAAGKPIMINHGGWQADVIACNECGVVLDPENIKNAAQTLVSFISDKEKIAAASVKAKQIALARFDSDVLTSSILNILESLVKVDHDQS